MQTRLGQQFVAVRAQTSPQPEAAVSSRPRPRRSKSRSAIPTWPLAKQLLSDRSSYGDCEDIASAHLAGRLFAGREPNLSIGSSQSGSSSSLAAKPSNYNHRRPFASPFERPNTGWLYNATKISEQSSSVEGKSELAACDQHHHSPGFDTSGANDASGPARD